MTHNKTLLHAPGTQGSWVSTLSHFITTHFFNEECKTPLAIDPALRTPTAGPLISHTHQLWIGGAGFAGASTALPCTSLEDKLTSSSTELREVGHESTGFHYSLHKTYQLHAASTAKRARTRTTAQNILHVSTKCVRTHLNTAPARCYNSMSYKLTHR